MIENKPQTHADADVQKITAVLAEYQRAHPASDVQAKRQNSVAIRVRIIDPAWAGVDRIDRNNRIWELLSSLSEDVQSQITMVLTLTPDEAKTSLANIEFEHPLRSAI